MNGREKDTKAHNEQIAKLCGRFGLTEEDREIWLTKVPLGARWDYFQSDREDWRFMLNLTRPDKS